MAFRISHRFAVLFILLMVSSLLQAQTGSPVRMKTITAGQDTVRIDTLSIVPDSWFLSQVSGKPCPREAFSIDPATALLIWNRQVLDSAGMSNGEFLLTYRVFPFLFSRSYRHKEKPFIEPDLKGIEEPFIYSYSEGDEHLFQLGGLTKSGSISRGLSFGNNQDVVVNSSLNLQLSGDLGDGIGILAAITDNNIPIQPEGNTQQIQEFDKVYIQLFTKSTRLTAGDFELTRPASYFLNLNKKAQGGLLSTTFNLRDKEKKPSGTLDVAAAGALSKGKYARNQVPAVEGNQGPYKLTGSEGETYIVILAGTEKVYIDGVLMNRGADQDYIIDYNLGEITFTPQQLITKDKRIIVEFEYSERSYARSMYYASLGYKGSRGGVRFHYFSEQDIKNQPLQQVLSDEEKQLLYRIGDSLWLAVVPNVDSVEFNNNEVLYKMVDTTVNAVLYDSIYVYSTNPDSAFYRLGFANVGAGKGNYIQVQSAANGRVFRWVAPQSGIPQGTHEPVMVLIPPRKKQMITLGGDYRIGKNTVLSAEAGLSDQDENTFSPADSYDDLGYSGRLNLENRVRLGRDSIRGWHMVTGLSHEYVSQYFQPVERFRTVEFERDWNIGSITGRSDEQLPGLSLSFENLKNQFVTYRYKAFLKGSYYKGYRHSLDGAYDLKNFFLTFNGAWLDTRAANHNSTYYRQKAQLAKKFRWLTLGIREAQEHNEVRYLSSDSLLGGSLAFEEYEAFINSNDTAKTRFSGTYKKRYDRLPAGTSLRLATVADDAGLGFELTRNPANLLKIKGTWRNLSILDSSLSRASEERTLLGRLEFFTRKFSKVLTSNTFYEAGSGLETKKEFSYVEVPAGQGIYVWTDYNGNGIKELNEFDVAAFTDQATYIRVFTPTTETIRAYYSQFSEGLNLDPANAWSRKKGFRKFLSRFALQFAYRTERKTTDQNLLRAYNPFRSAPSDTALLSLNSSMRSSLFFNRSNPKAGGDIAYTDNRNKTLLVNGFDTRTQQSLTLHLRWNITRFLMMNLTGNYGKKTSHSDYFSNRAYALFFDEVNPQFQIQPGKSFRFSLQYKYTHKINSEGSLGELAIMHNAGVEFKYSIAGKGSLILKANYIKIHFNATENSPLAYDMLEGFKKGNNLTWNLGYQRNLSENLQMNLVYDGRQTPGNKMVHVGSIQLRAYF